MAEIILDLGGGMDTLQRQTRTAQKALSGLEKQLQSMGKAMGSLMERISPAKILEQTQKVVKRTTTTVRRETGRVLADFDKLNRLETDKTTTTVTTSVTTTQAAKDAEAVSKTDLAPLITMFGTLQTAIASVSVALQK